jgi:hypothetical protein
VPEMMKGRPRQGAPSANTTTAGTGVSACVDGRLRGVKFKFSARACRCGSDVCTVGAELVVSCSECGVRRGRLTERTAGFLRQIVSTFGLPDKPVILRRAGQ